MEQNTDVMEATMQPEAEEMSSETIDNETQPQESEEIEEEDNGAEVLDESKDVLPFVVRYNHKDRELSREEAVDFAQKGMKLDSLSPMLDDLSYLAAIKGKTPQELIKEYIQTEEDLHKSEIIDNIGSDKKEIVDVLMEKYRTENRSKFEKAKNERKQAEEAEEKKAIETLESRIADEFVELKTYVPSIQSLSDVPKDVLKEAEKGKNLCDAYLRYQQKEKERIDGARQTAANNSKSSAGRINGDAENDPAAMALLNSLRS